MTWIPFALALPIFAAAIPLINEHFKVNPIHLVIFYRIMAIFLFLPVLFIFPLPEDPYFYLFVLIAGLIGMYFDTMYFSSAATAGAGVTARVLPFVVLIGFVLWLCVDPEMIQTYIQKPIKGAGIICSFAMATYFALRLKSCPLSLRTIKLLLPAILLGSITIVLGKLAMDHSPPISGPYFYVLIQSIFIVPPYIAAINLKFCRRHLPMTVAGPIFTKQICIAGLSVGLSWSLLMIFKYTAFSRAENPAYVSLFELLSPLLISIFYMIRKQKETTDVIAGFGIIASVALLIISTQIL